MCTMSSCAIFLVFVMLITGDVASYMMSAELGLKWKILKNKDINTGFYLDYGLNNIQNKKIKHFQEAQ